MLRNALFLAIISLVFSISTARADDSGLEAYVVRVDPNCAIVVSNDSKAFSEDAAYRLYGIGIPSANQPFGSDAHKYLSGLLPKGTLITIQKFKDADSAGSLPEALVQVYGKSVNHALIREGFAWVDRQTCKGLYCRRWHIEEHRAIEARKGIWSSNIPTPPWQWGR